MNLKTLAIILVGVIVIGIANIPLFSAQFFRTHDFIHGARIVELYRNFQEGQIPPRWSQNFGYGYGMPTFQFYGPFPYLLPALAFWLSNDMLFSLHVLWFVPTLVGYIGTYFFVKKFMGRVSATIAATSFTLAPYRAVDLYVRGALGEAWGMMLFPWLLWSAYRYVEKPSKNRFIILSFLIGVLFITHNLMALMFIPMVGVFGLVMFLTKWKKEVKSKNLGKEFLGFIFSFFIGLGLAAFYVIPALAEKGYTQIDTRILGGYFSYTQHFLYIRQFFMENWKYGGSQWGPSDDISFFLGYGQMGLLVLGMGAFTGWLAIQFTKKKKLKVTTTHFLAGISLVLFILSCLFCTIKSQFIWDAISLMQTIQFPWRFLSTAIFFLAILNAFAIHLIQQEKLKLGIAGLSILAFIIPAFTYFKPERPLDRLETFYYSDPERIKSEMSGIWPDFLPKNFKGTLSDGTSPISTVRFEASSGQDVGKDVQVVVDRSHQLLLSTNFIQPQKITLHIADFPGWTVSINNQETTFNQTSKGLIEVDVPAGNQLVAADLHKTPVRFIADSITAIVVLGILFSQIDIKKVKEKRA